MGAVLVALVGFQLWQMQLVWLLPILGAGLVLYMLEDSAPKPPSSDSSRSDG